MQVRSTRPVIFLAFANDRSDAVRYLRNLPEEARQLTAALQPAEQAGLCEVVVRANCTAGDIFEVFQDPRYRNRIAIFHYGGHANGYQVLLESTDGRAAAANAQGLAHFLGYQRALELVFLNGCSTQKQTEGLLAANVSLVISTSQAIDDAIATEFSRRFYSGLASGASIRTAFGEAESAIQMEQGANTRLLYAVDAEPAAQQFSADRWPWNLYVRSGSESADEWNLPEAANAPLFGLPVPPSQDLPTSPYRHLHWFTKEDSPVFFGRDREIRALYDRLVAPHTAPVIMFYGQSGVGKSSLLDAGLIPRLERDHDVYYLRRDAQQGLVGTLGLAFLPEAADVPLIDAWRAKELHTGRPLIIVLDQVEEAFTRPMQHASSADELTELLDTISGIFKSQQSRPRGRLILSFRKEWLAEFEAKLQEYEIPRTKVFLEALDRRGVISVVRGPADVSRLAQHYELEIEGDLAEIIADDLLDDRDAAIAPTLQILLTKMWMRATALSPTKPRFTRDLYLDLKRNGILLRDFLNQQFAIFREKYPEVVDSGLLLDLVALHTTPLGTADHCQLTQLRQMYSHLDTDLADLLQQCQDLHLLTISTDAQESQDRTSRLAHDTLAPLVREQFESSDKPGQRARRILDNRVVDWGNQQEGTPLDEADLTVVEEGIVGTRSLSAAEQRLLEASRTLRARMQWHYKLVQTFGVFGVIAITMLAVVGWYLYNVAGIARQTAELDSKTAQDARKDAESAQGRLLNSTREAQQSQKQAERLAYQLHVARAMDIYRDDPKAALAILDDPEKCPPEYRGYLWGYFHEKCNRQTSFYQYPATITALDYSPDGSLLAIANESGKIHIRRPKGSLELKGHRHSVDDLAYSSDGDMLASCAHGEIKVWDPQTGRETGSFTADTFDADTSALHESLIFLPSESNRPLLAYASNLHNSISFFDAQSGEEVGKNDHGSPVVHLSHGPHPDTLLVACVDSVIRLSRVGDDKPVFELPRHKGVRVVRDMVAVGMDDNFRLLTANDAYDVIVWEWTGDILQVAHRFQTSRTDVHAVAITQNGNRIAWGSADTIEIRDLTNDAYSLSLPVESANDAVESQFAISRLDFKASDQSLAASRHGMAFVWQTRDSIRIDDPSKAPQFENAADEELRLFVMQKTELNGQTGGQYVVCGAPSQNRIRIALGLANGQILIVSTATGERVGVPIHAYNGSAVNALAWSPGGLIASASNLPKGKSIGEIRLWDAETGQTRGMFVGHDAIVTNLKFSDDETVLWSKDVNGEIRAWHGDATKTTGE
ncbi:MAG: CHAT domain-containing protein [Planctomycetaceae bacterium]